MEPEESLKKYTLIITTMASFLSPFMSNAINLAVPSIGTEFKSSAMLLNWVVSSYILVSAAVVLPCGRLSDLWGRKKIFVYGLTIFSVSSFLCSMAWSTESLIVFRILQGLGSAMTYSTATAILSSVFPPQIRGKALGIVTTSTFIGFALGPVLGGLLTHSLGWKSIFYFAFTLGTAVLVLTVAKLKGEWAEAKGERFDNLGTALYVIGIVAFIYGFSSIVSLPWAKYILAIGLSFMALFVWHESRVKYPILNVGFFGGNVTFIFANLAALIYFITTASVNFLLSLHLQIVMGYNSQVAGLVLLSQPLIMAVLSPYAGVLSDRIDPRIVTTCGMSLTTLALAVLCLINVHTPIWFLASNLVFLGAGAAFFSSPNTNSVMGSVPREFYGVASSTLGTMRNIGQAISIATISLIINLFIGSARLGPANASILEKSVRIIFVIFAITSFLGIFTSLARGKINDHETSQLAFKTE